MYPFIKKSAQIIEMLVDIIAKNGVMLLNVLQKPDGSIDAEARYILEEMAKWYEICGEAVYAFMMQDPASRVAVIKSLQPEEKVAKVRLLGYGEVEYVQNYGVLTVKLPEKLPTEYTNCLALTLE